MLVFQIVNNKKPFGPQQLRIWHITLWGLGRKNDDAKNQTVEFSFQGSGDQQTFPEASCFCYFHRCFLIEMVYSIQELIGEGNTGIQIIWSKHYQDNVVWQPRKWFQFPQKPGLVYGDWLTGYPTDLLVRFNLARLTSGRPANEICIQNGQGIRHEFRPIDIFNILYKYYNNYDSWSIMIHDQLWFMINYDQ